MTSQALLGNFAKLCKSFTFIYKANELQKSGATVTPLS